MLPYKGKKEDHIKLMKKGISQLIPPKITTTVLNTSRKLSTCFNIRDKNKFNHQHNLF